MTHRPTVTKNYKNTQREFDSNLGACDVSVAPRAVRLSTSPGTQLLLLLKGNSDVPLFFHILNYPPYKCKPSKNCNPAALSCCLFFYRFQLYCFTHVAADVFLFLVSVVLFPVRSRCMCVFCVFFPFILDVRFVGRTNRGHTGGRSHRISHPPSFCGACLNFPREKDSAIPFPRRP